MKETQEQVKLALQGNSDALEYIMLAIKDDVFNLSLRMLGTIADAQDASQDIFIKVLTNLSNFRMEANFHTWVYRIAVNYLIDYKKSMFAQQPLDFDFYANDIRAGYVEDMNEILSEYDADTLAEELKLSCTNVMLQCLDPTSRCVFILGTMFHVNSKIAGDILHMTPANYRQLLSRAKKKMANFLMEYCGLTKTGQCSCRKRISYAIEQHRLHPGTLEYSSLPQLNRQLLNDYKDTMNEIESQMIVFNDLKNYELKLNVSEFIERLTNSAQMEKITRY